MRTFLVLLSLMVWASGLSGCFHGTPHRFLVRDAETGGPIGGASVQVSYFGAMINPETAMAATGVDGTVVMPVVEDSRPVWRASAPGYMEWNSERLRMGSAADAGVDTVIELWRLPRTDVEFIVPDGYRGLFRARIPAERGGVVTPRRAFRYVVSAEGDVALGDDPVLRELRTGPLEMYERADFRARFANGEEIPEWQGDVAAAGDRLYFRPWIGFDEFDVFMVGTDADMRREDDLQFGRGARDPGASERYRAAVEALGAKQAGASGAEAGGAHGGEAAGAAAARSLLDRMSSAYRSLSGYEDEGDVEVHFANGMRFFRQPFATHFSADGPFLFEVESAMPPGAGVRGQRCEVVWDGVHAPAVDLDGRPFDLNCPDISFALAALVGVSAGASITVPPLLFPSAERGVLNELRGVRLLRDGEVDGAACYGIGGTSMPTEEYLEVWIDKTDLLVRRVDIQDRCSGGTRIVRVRPCAHPRANGTLVGVE